MSLSTDHPRFHRMQLLTGATGLDRLAATRVIVFGVGGVGSWAAEGLVRSGIRHVTIVDADRVCVTNINRQVQASMETVGQPKVNALKARLLAINPDAEVEALERVYDKHRADQFELDRYDYVIDAIDSLSSKVELLARAVKSRATLFCSLGAACKLDASRIKTAPIWETRGCRLGRFVRKRLRNRGVRDSFVCVYSNELRPVQEGTIEYGTGDGVCPRKQNEGGSNEEEHEWCSAKQPINGSAVHITAIFGFTLCGLVLDHLLKPIKEIRPHS